MRPTSASAPRIESLLSARLFISPQLVGRRLVFESNLSGHISLYGMDHGGSVPEPLLPPDVVLHNPTLIPGYPYYVFPKLKKILVMIDHHGDENYQPMFVPVEGGTPEPIFVDLFQDHRVSFNEVDADRNIAYFVAESRKESIYRTYRADLRRQTAVKMSESKWGGFVDGFTVDHRKAILIDGYTAGDNVLYVWREGAGERTLLYGKPLEVRKAGEIVPPNGIHSCTWISKDRAILFHTTLFEDAGGLSTLDIADPSEPTPVRIMGVKHQGAGELNGVWHLKGNRFGVGYNIDGCSWVYEATFDGKTRTMRLGKPLVGRGRLANGVLENIRYDKHGDRFALSFSTATSPTQLFTIEGRERKVVQHSREKVLGIRPGWLSAGEDASFTSFDDTRISARLYLPPKDLGFRGPRPLVYYIHGGPQSQERPDFAWFSMPLIQFLTLNGFAVFVPNVRGSSGYGMAYMKQVDRDWGGQDRLDHVHAMTEVLPKDKRIDVRRAAVVGRSYGGYMTLIQVGQHPDLWAAACDMFGPYDLLTFMDRIPATWKPYFAIAVGDPERDRDFLVERSPRTRIENLACPLLVIQGKNDPRVVERESRDLVEHLRSQGKEVEYLMFEDEGHDVLTFENRVRCYNAIVDFFKKHLKP
jgi:pimeloyl-ACP methyl ester carboxylesterase